MDREHEVVRRFSALSKMELSSKEQEEIWNGISTCTKVNTLRRKRRRNPLIGMSAAAIAAIVLVAGGSYAILERQTVLLNSSQSTGQDRHNVPLQFPRLIQESMKQIPSNLRTFAKAPTVLPVPQSTSKVLTYRTWGTDKTSPIMGYNVVLAAGGSQIAMFSGTRYLSRVLATNAVTLPEPLTSGGPSSITTVHLRNGVLAQGKTFDAKQSAKGSSFGQLRWKFNQWHIQVMDNQSPHLPINVANSVVRDLQTVTLPAAADTGTVYVDIEADNQVGSYIKWKDGLRVYEIDTYSTCKDPVMTGLDMVVSMRAYT